MSCSWQVWIGADGSTKSNGLGLVLNLQLVRSSKAAERGTEAGPALAWDTCLGVG